MRRVFFTLLFFITSLTAVQQQPYDAIINLGGDCQPAYQMHINGVRHYALPFDKVVTPFPALQALLENKFGQFLKPENLELKGSGKEKHIVDKHYDVRLFHDFPKEEGFLKEYETIKATYDRRIDRFLTLIAESKNPLFIRKNITKEQAIKLAAILLSMCKHKNFTILALDGAEAAKDSWHVENVTNMHLRQPEPYVWKGDNTAWKEVFTAVGLTLTTKADSTPEI